MQKTTSYHHLTASEYYDIVACSAEPPEEAVYMLLQRRLHRALHRVFNLHGFGLSDDFNDTIDEFFLYLYEGNDGSCPPFSIVNSIHHKEAFFAWTLATYRNFLLNKAKEEVQRKNLLEQAQWMSKGEKKGLSLDTMIRYLAAAIAYADQCFKPGNLFIFYRSILSLLDRNRAIPQEAMAEAMKLHPVTYRVRCKRQRDCFQRLILTQEAGQRLELDRRHELMRCCIEEEFNRLYDLLIGYYHRVLEQLPDKGDIRALRLKYYQKTGMVMHESQTYGYRIHMNVEALYRALKS